MQRPDFRTINDFRKDNIKQIESYFIDVLHIGKDLGLAKMGEIFIDGTKMRANASAKRTKDKEGYEKWLKRINGEFSLMCTTKNIYSIYKHKLELKRA